MNRVQWLKAYPGLTLHQKIETRGIMWTSHLMADLHYSIDRINQLDSKNYLGELKQTMRMLYRKTGFERFNPQKLVTRKKDTLVVVKQKGLISIRHFA